MLDLASKYLNDYITEYTDDYLALFYIGKCYYKLGQYEKSIMHLYESYKINDNDNRIKFFIGLNHKNLEEYSDAAKFFKKKSCPRTGMTVVTGSANLGQNYKKVLKKKN